MKKVILPALLVLFLWSFKSYAQVTTIESFDNISNDTNYVWTGNVEGSLSYLTVKEDSTDKVTGSAASLDVRTALGAYHPWGTYSQLYYRLPTGQTMDWSASDTISLWLKVTMAPKQPQYMVFRIQLADQDAPGDPIEQYIYENDSILTKVSGWIQIKVPLKMITSDGTITPGDSGFVISPSTWGGFTYNDHKLNLDKLVGWNLGFIVSGYTAGVNLPADSIEVKLDEFQRSGNKSIPFVIFNGLSSPAQLGSPWTWGGASAGVATGAGPVPNSNAVMWTMGDQYNNGWCGFGWTLSAPFNLSGGWQTDSLKFLMKTNAVSDSLRVQFESGGGKVGLVFNTAPDTNWHQYSFALRDIKTDESTNPSGQIFDPSQIGTFGFMTQNDSASPSRILGKVAYITNIWTGNPVINVLPPVAPTGVIATANADNSNTVVWTDVPDQPNGTYNVYYSLTPITDITAPGVEIAATGIVHGIQSSTTLLRAPSSDQNVTYYYAVVCRSDAGVLGTPGVTSQALTNMAKGVTVISTTAPNNFQADGDLSEWTGITPFRIYFSDHSGTPAPNSKISSDSVSSGDAYVAMDQNYLYVALHVNTNNIVFNASQSSWLNTAADMFIGLYNWHGASHTTLQTGAQPDYHLRFAQDRIIIDNDGVDSLEVPGSNYFWGSRFPDPLAGYNVEAKISWQDLAHKRNGGNSGTDNVFVPQVGMRIPIDFELGTCSVGATSRDGQLDYSPIALGNSYANVAVWSYTWIGDQWYVTGVKDKGNSVVNSYQLEQNYPNPFNPSTQIKYSIMRPGMVSLKIYDILGREVATLINQFQTQGTYTVNFDASKLSSGVYFYKIESGSFQNVKKMMLLK